MENKQNVYKVYISRISSHYTIGYHFKFYLDDKFLLDPGNLSIPNDSLRRGAHGQPWNSCHYRFQCFRQILYCND